MGSAPFLRFSYASRLRLALVLAAGMAACKPQIGGRCTTSTDCSQTGDRLCDISQPGGYCTIFNCEPEGSNASTKCPDEAACIALGESPSPVPGCENDLGSTAYQRSFCLKKCNHTSDCRSGYVCKDLATDPRYKAVDVDGPTKVCTVDFDAPAPVTDGPDAVSTGVCTGTSNVDWDAGLLPTPINAGETSSAGGGETSSGGSDTGGVTSGPDSAGTSSSGAGTEGN
ncbi:MAG TPA: hypothetical protein VMI54_18850 [Polyangiaceae bacterium]|nr:hypothetical protein [Polyangiaceae bacterium]